LLLPVGELNPSPDNTGANIILSASQSVERKTYLPLTWRMLHTGPDRNTTLGSRRTL